MLETAHADSVDAAPPAAEPALARAPRFSRGWQVAIFLVALVLRALHLWGESHSPFFAFRGIDALDYHQMALGMHDGSWPDSQPFFWAPLYPLILGLLYGLVGTGALAIKAIQACLGAASCVLLYRIGRRLFAAPWIAVTAGVAAGLHGTLIYFDGELLSACLDVFLQLLTLELLLAAGQAGGTGHWAAAGIAMGLSIINRGAMLLLLPWVVVWCWAVARRGWPVGIAEGRVRATRAQAGRAVAGVIVPSVILLALVVAHNVRSDPASRGQFGILPVAHNMGINFYLGNHWSLREINKTAHPSHFSHYDRFMQMPVDAGVSGAFAGSQFLFHRTLADIRAAPREWLQLMVVKFGELLRGSEIPRSANLYAHRRSSLVLRALLWSRGIGFPAGLVIPLGLVGLGIACAEWRRHLLAILAVLTQGAFVLMFFVTARYRLPAMPLLILYGVSALAFMAGAFRALRWGRVGLAAVATAGLLFVSNWDVRAASEEPGYYEYCLLGQVYHQHGNIAAAEDWYREGLRLNPDYAWAHLQLGRVLLQQKRWREAESHLRRCLELEPDTPNVPAANVMLGQALAGQGRTREAVALWEAALARDPAVPVAHAELCAALRRLGRAGDAAPHCTAAAEAAARNAEIVP